MDELLMPGYEVSSKLLVSCYPSYLTLEDYRLANALPQALHGNGFSFVCVLS
jgi:hypothetical protein